MPRFRFSLFPRNARFYDLFADLSHQLLRTSEAMCDLFEHFENAEMKARHISDLEAEADDVTHAIYTLMNQSFLTPIDREDIAALAQRMDDVVDFIEATTTSLAVYRITQITIPARGLADLIRLQCIEIVRAIEVLRENRRLTEIIGLAREINRLENDGDALFLSAMAELFDGEWGSTDIIKWREIYDGLENACDASENVAYVLESIVLKHG